MDWSGIIQQLLYLVIIAVVIPVARKIVSYLGTKIDDATKERLAEYISIGVTAAEQIYQEGGMGELKKQYVLDYVRGLITDNIVKTGMSYEQLDTLIEAIVNEIKQENI